MNSIKCLLFLIVTIFTMKNTYASDLRGTWEGKDYSISISETFEYIRGNWGDTAYNLNVSNTFQYLRGSIDGQNVSLSFSKTFSYVRGELPCGQVNYSYSNTFGYIRGTNCGEDFNIRAQNPEEASATAEDIYLDEVLSEFPAPARSAVRRFIRARINL